MSEQGKSDKKSQLIADSSWFHVFRSMVDGGDIAKMNPTTIVVYIVIKSHSNYGTGKSFPSIELIALKSGTSQRTVMRCLDELEKFGYISKEKVGRHNTYVLKEKVEIKDDDGKNTAVATFDYIPNLVGAAQTELKRFVMTGDSKYMKVIHIENLTMNVQIINGGEGTQFNLDSIKDQMLRKRIEKIEEARAREKKKS